MPEPRYQRRKEDRPAEITAAALAAFSEKGYSATRVEEVAKRAGISKGLLYLYFKTKEDLFKAVIRSFVAPKVDALLASVEESELSAEEFLRGPFLAMAQELPKSRARILVRLLLAEGPKYPDLLAYYWENVVSQGLEALRKIIDKGVQSGEFRASALQEFPQMLVSPVLVSVAWNTLFEKQQSLDTDRFIAAHLDMMIDSIRATGQQS